jgi:hypothetical protein
VRVPAARSRWPPLLPPTPPPRPRACRAGDQDGRIFEFELYTGDDTYDGRADANNYQYTEDYTGRVFSWAVHPCSDVLPYICQLPVGNWNCEPRWGGCARSGCANG